MASEGIAGAYLASGWCGRCGGKRDIDNNCVNCDRWYNHPLLILGGSLTVSLVLLMLVGIRSVRDADPGFARFASGLMHPMPMPEYAPSAPISRGPVGPPKFFQSVGAPAVMAPPPTVAPLEAQFAQLEALRETVHATERVYRTGAFSTESSPRTAGQAHEVAAQAVETTVDSSR